LAAITGNIDRLNIFFFIVATLLAYSWNKARHNKKYAVGRLALAVVTAMNSLNFNTPDYEPEDGDDCDHPSPTPVTWADTVRASRKKLRDAAYTIAVQQAILAGWSADDYLDERWSRLGRVIMWAGHSPYDRKVRGMMLLACSMCLGKTDDEHMLDPLDITVSDVYSTDLEAAKRSRFKILSILSRITSPDNLKAVFAAVATWLVSVTMPNIPILWGLLTSLWGQLFKVISSGQWWHQ
jgi:hypothetical protein